MQVRPIRTCAWRAHTPRGPSCRSERGTGGESDDPAFRTGRRGVREGRPMTPGRTRPPLGVATLDGAIAALRAGGLRVSAARRLVLEALFAADGPATVEQLADGVGGRGPRPDVGPTHPHPATPATPRPAR